MPEPFHYQPSRESPPTFAISIHDVLTGPYHAGEPGESVLLRTDRGDIQAILHPAPEARHGVIRVGGARGASAGRAKAPMPGARTCCVGTGSPPCGCATVIPTFCRNVHSTSWLASPT